MEKSAALLIVVLAAVMWAGSGTAAQHFFENSDRNAIELSNIRMILAGLTLLPAAWATGGLRRGLKSLWKRPRFAMDLVLYAAIGIFLVQYTYFQGIAEGSAAATTVLCYTCPAMVVLYDSLASRRLPKVSETLTVLSAMLGILLLVTGGRVDELSVPPACVAWSLLSGACFAFSAIFPRHLLREIDQYFLLAFGMLLGGAGSCFFVDGIDWQPFFAPEVIFDVVYIVIFGTSLAFLLFNAGLTRLSPEEATVTATVEPLASVLLARIIFGTTFGAVETIGIGLVMAAILMPVLPIHHLVKTVTHIARSLWRWRRLKLHGKSRRVKSGA